jgi:hypothetical protein
VEMELGRREFGWAFPRRHPSPRRSPSFTTPLTICPWRRPLCLRVRSPHPRKGSSTARDPAALYSPASHAAVLHRAAQQPLTPPSFTAPLSSRPRRCPLARVIVFARASGHRLVLSPCRAAASVPAPGRRHLVPSPRQAAATTTASRSSRVGPAPSSSAAASCHLHAGPAPSSSRRRQSQLAEWVGARMGQAHGLGFCGGPFLSLSLRVRDWVCRHILDASGY